MFRGLSVVVIAVALVAAGLLEAASVAQNQFVWTQNAITYNSAGYRLNGFVSATYNNTYVVSMCALRCLRTSADRCASYNFIRAQRKCELNSASHVTQAAALTTDADSRYFQRNAFIIDQAALGPCASSPCQNGGTCLTLTATDGTFTSRCLCAKEWTGNTCHVAAASPVWGEWSDWSTCSVSCGDGMTSRRRSCLDSVTRETLGSKLCVGQSIQEKACDGGQCPGWSDYSNYGQCSSDASCGSGIQTRTHSCTNGGTPGVDPMCMGPVSQTTPCQSPSCTAAVRLVGGATYGEGRVNIYDDVHNRWLPVCANQWTTTNANVVCRQLGFSAGAVASTGNSYGNEVGATTAFSGVSCQGNELFLAQCQHTTWIDTSCASGPHAGVQCIVNGGWNNWSTWSACSVTCATGTSTRNRTCTSPAPLRGGATCTGNAQGSQPCTMPNCPIDATWTDWSAWSACNVTCGGGSQSRTRTCNPGLYGGLGCVGSSTTVQSCNTQPCPVDGTWSDWTSWSSCNQTCGSGTSFRTRTCTPPQYGGKQCQGSTVDTQSCSDNPCPVDGAWSAWSPFKPCSVTCGNGTQSRYRICSGAANGGTTCPGSANDFQSCNMGNCPVNCTWNDWSSWSTCSVTCGGGTSTRTRTNTGALYGGTACTGDSQQSQVCNTNPCYTPGLWLPWSGWSKCSTTCGDTGVRTRTRVCNMTSFGQYTSQCLPTNGINSTDSKPCNRYSCTPAPIHCADLYNRGLEENDTYIMIDPDEGSSLAPFGVQCQRNSTGIFTIVHTSSEAQVKVQGYEGDCKYSTTVAYVDQSGKSISVAQVIQLIEKSPSCKQFISWYCFSSAINIQNTNANPMKVTYWKNRYGDSKTYWGGVPYDSIGVSPTSLVMCQCGLDGSCPKSGTKCNCDAMDNQWRTDSGYITYGKDLPVTTFCAGDTGVPGENVKMGYYIVGPVVC